MANRVEWSAEQLRAVLPTPPLYIIPLRLRAGSSLPLRQAKWRKSTVLGPRRSRRLSETKAYRTILSSKHTNSRSPKTSLLPRTNQPHLELVSSLYLSIFSYYQTVRLLRFLLAARESAVAVTLLHTFTSSTSVAPFPRFLFSLLIGASDPAVGVGESNIRLFFCFLISRLLTSWCRC